jgi:hypothetical protein
MNTATPQDASSYARVHAGEHERDLTPAQRDLLGRVIAKRIERGVKLETIGRAVAHALPELDVARARRLGRDEALRALGWETLREMGAQGRMEVALSPVADACPTCYELRGTYPLDAVPVIPVAGCTHLGGCRCAYRLANDDAHVPASTPEAAPPADAESPQPERPWYRPRPPRPHPPRWSEERKEAARRARERARAGKGPRSKP